MKSFKIVLLALACLVVTLPAFGQKVSKTMKKEILTKVGEMDETQQRMVLDYAFKMKKVKLKKELAKTLKGLSPEDAQKVLDYSGKISRVDAKNAPRQGRKLKEVAPQKLNAGNITKVEVLDQKFDFGTIKQGEKAETVYRIKNVGNKPLIISKAKGSCGCTVPSWPKEAVAPGDIAEIKVVFNSRGKKGKQSKRITITANTDPVQTFLTISGTVEVKPTDVKKPVPAKQ